VRGCIVSRTRCSALRAAPQSRDPPRDAIPTFAVDATYLLSADGENNEIRVLKREDGTVVGSFGRNGRNAGQFHWVHAMAVDAQGNVYTAEVDTGKRIQKFKLTSDALR
jgi:hypothetical protein